MLAWWFAVDLATIALRRYPMRNGTRTKHVLPFDAPGLKLCVNRFTLFYHASLSWIYFIFFWKKSVLNQLWFIFSFLVIKNITLQFLNWFNCFFPLFGTTLGTGATKTYVYGDVDRLTRDHRPVTVTVLSLIFYADICFFRLPLLVLIFCLI